MFVKNIKLEGPQIEPVTKNEVLEFSRIVVC